VSLPLLQNRKSIPALIDFVVAYADEMMFEEKRIEQFRLSLEDAFGNIVRFACTGGDETIRLSLRYP
jgi:hypothetical protein